MDLFISYKKKFPDITDAEIRSKLTEWYQSRPGAEDGDGSGVPGDISRFYK